LARVSTQSIEALKLQVNLVDVVAPYVQLKQAGRSWKGLSPFTSEKTPSFYVHPDKGFYKCFSTGEGGDLFSFIMKLENIEFPEAVEFIAKRFNFQLSYETGGPDLATQSLRKQLFELHELVSEWFHRQLLESSTAENVRHYWQTKRAFDLKVAQQFKIGFAPPEPYALYHYCRQKNIQQEALQASGLFFNSHQSKRSAELKSRFRGRLMIPIRDVQGRVVAFTARQLEETPSDDPSREAKYVNSPETQIFQKGRILFGMDHARKHVSDSQGFLMVEGQLDAIRCWTCGLNTAVAPQGTAITEEQIHLLQRYQPPYVYCLLDGDQAGHKATERILPMAFKSGIDFRFICLEEGQDPDELLAEKGAAAIEALQASALNPIELTIQTQLPDTKSASTAQKIRVLQALFDLIRHEPSTVAREDYIQISAKLLGVDPLAALRDYQQFAARAQTKNASHQQKNLENTKSTDTRLTQAVWELLSHILHFPNYASSIAKAVHHEWINTSQAEGKLLVRLLAEYREGLLESTDSLEKLIRSEFERKLLADIHSRELEIENPKQQIEICIQTLYKNYLSNRLDKLKTDAQQPLSKDALHECRLAIKKTRALISKTHLLKIDSQ
jgi:DNA primase